MFVFTCSGCLKKDKSNWTKDTSALVTIWAPDSLAEFAIAEDTEPIPPSTYLQIYGFSCIIADECGAYNVTKAHYVFIHLKEENVWGTTCKVKKRWVKWIKLRI